MIDEHVSNRTPDGQAADVERWGWYSIGVNVILALINLAIAQASGSLAVEAEMVHNVVDFLTAVGVLIGLKLATRKSKAFPYGLYKIENIVLVVLAVMTFRTAYEIGRDALFATARVATVNAWMLVGVVVAVAIPRPRPGTRVLATTDHFQELRSPGARHLGGYLGIKAAMHREISDAVQSRSTSAGHLLALTA